jgi:hypothetical protein
VIFRFLNLFGLIIKFCLNKKFFVNIYNYAVNIISIFTIIIIIILFTQTIAGTIFIGFLKLINNDYNI